MVDDPNSLADGSTGPAQLSSLSIDETKEWNAMVLYFLDRGSVLVDAITLADRYMLALRERRATQPLPSVLREVLGERKVQDAKWGGPAHDDLHDWHAWCCFFEKQLRRASAASDLRRDCLINVAALAVACVESMDRGGLAKT